MIKITHMKPTFFNTAAAIIFIALMLPACNESSDKAIHAADSSVTAAADTIKTAADTIVRKIDSSLQNKIDTTKSRLHAAGDTLSKRIHR
jgi:hypothetical protein